MPSPFVIEKASILCYRIYDIADEISLEKASSLLSADAQRLRLNRENSQYLLLPNPPLTVELRNQSLPLRGGAVTVEAFARIFDYGAASIIVRVPVPPNTPFDQLVALADELYDSAAVDQLTLSLIEGVRKSVYAALEDPHLWEQSESYTITFVERIQGNPTANTLFEGADLTRLLLGETSGSDLSERERREVTQHRFSYREDDLAVVDWNSAFVYEPSGSSDIPDVLEIINAQLLELRYYDDVLDKNVLAIYEEVQRKRRSWFSIVRSPYKRLARRVLALLLEMSEFIERVENSIKIIGDFYLAKVYEAAVQRLRIRSWQASVTRKQQMLANVYQLLKGELDTDRSLLLEATIVLLIIGEILMAVGPMLKH